MSGWISLHRKIMDHPFYKERRKFSKYEAWLDIMMLANHQDNKFIHGNKLVEVERGSFITSELKLMERWDWGKEKLRSFLKLLEADGMIIKTLDRKQTTIKVLNYGDYQPSPDHKQTNNRPLSDHDQTVVRPSPDTNNNVNNDNKVKKEKKKTTYTPEFDEFWNVYPRKIGKVECFKTWERVIKNGEHPSFIIQCATNYAKDCEMKGTEDRFIKHPKTFLNDERYKDYKVIVMGGGNSGKHGQYYGRSEAENRAAADKDADLFLSNY